MRALRRSAARSACAVWYSLLLCCPGSLAQTILQGDLSGLYPRAQYIVDGTARVPSGKTLVFEAGSKVYFAEFGGLDVQGALECRGTISSPVLLTSLNDGPFNKSGKLPESFDWSGVSAGAGAVGFALSHTQIRYSTFGLQVASAGNRGENVLSDDGTLSH